MGILLTCAAVSALIGSVLAGNCSLTPPSARANDCNGGGCECWCSPNEGAYTIWQWAPSGPIAGGPDTCCYDPASDPPCFAAKPLLSNTLGSHMVLQSAPRSAQLFGWATPGDTISIELQPEHGTGGHAQHHTTRVANDSSWAVSLDAVAAGGPYNISVHSARLNDGVVLDDVLFGELWMCGGQSNMELTVQQAFNASEELRKSHDYPTIRLFTVGQEYADTSRGAYRQLRSVWQDWSVASPQALGAGNWTVFSAACWYFGRALQESLHVPVGLVSNNWGGTSIAPWMSPDAVKACPAAMDTSQLELAAERLGMSSEDTPASVRSTNRPMPTAPSVLWDTMVAPFTRQTFRGVVWYQGESNAIRGHNAEAATYYSCAIKALISDWRAKFNGDGDLAFHQTLLAPINTVWGFAGVRLGQQAALALNDSGIASAMDSGDPFGPWQGTLHPRDKQTLGARLALVARGLTYGEQDELTFEGPRMTRVEVERPSPERVHATVSFVPRSLGAPHAVEGVGLVLRAQPVPGTLAAGCLPNVTNALCGYFDIIFTVGGSATEQSVQAEPSLSADATQLVLAATVPEKASILRVEAMNNEWPVVRVYNRAGLPMYPFVHNVTASQTARPELGPAP